MKIEEIIEEIKDEELLELYFSLAYKFNNSLNDVKLDKLFAVEDEILRRMKKEWNISKIC